MSPSGASFGGFARRSFLVADLPFEAGDAASTAETRNFGQIAN
jgi:hypothetical protein